MLSDGKVVYGEKPEINKNELVRIFEIASNKEVWRIGVYLKEGEF